MIRRCLQFSAGLAFALMMAACIEPFDNDNDEAKPWDREIPAADYRLSDVRCVSQPGQTVVDDEIVDDTHWVVVGRLHNELATSSPIYDLKATVTDANGSIDETGGTLFRSVGSRGSAEFRIFAGGEARPGEAPLTQCEVAVFDSVLNYAQYRPDSDE